MVSVFTDELTNSQARSDVLGIILSALLILVGLLWQQIQPRNPEAVTLIGEEGFELAEQGHIRLRFEQGDEVAEEGDARRGGVQKEVEKDRFE
jgi:hypothetical protein